MKGHSFPKSWGRLVGVVVDAEKGYGESLLQVFTFEDKAGNIRVVRADLNWRKFAIDDIQVITISRH